MALISVIIPVRNGAATLGIQLEAIERAGALIDSYEVVIADNGSTDATRAVARQSEGRMPIRVVDASRKAGINVARNEGVRHAQGTWIALCDADDVVDTNWLMQLHTAFGQGHQLVAGPLDYRELQPSAVRQWRGAEAARVGVELNFLPTGHGANLAFSRTVWEQIGGFDESFIGGGDDTDFCWRAQLAGFVLHEAGDALVHYRLRDTMPELWRQAVNYGRSEVLLFQKYREHGLHRRSLGALVRELWWLVSRVPFLLPLGRRGAWVRKAGQQWGRLLGSIRLRAMWW